MEKRESRRAKGEGSIIETPKGFRGYATHREKRYYVSGKTKKETGKKLKDLIKLLDTGQTPGGSKYTVGEWLDHWMETTEDDRKPLTNVGYKLAIRAYLKPEIGKTKLDRLTVEQVEAAYKSLAKKGLKGSTLHQAHSVLRVALKRAVWRGHLPNNVAALVKPPTPDKPDTKALSEADLSVLYGALASDRYRARWHLALDLGVRPSEAIALEWKHVDFDNRTITIEQQILQVQGQGAILQESTKTGAGTRVISAPGHILEMFRELRKQQQKEMATYAKWKTWEPDGKPHAWCFTRPDGAVIRPRYDAQLWKELLEGAGLPHVKRYTARHTAASMAIADGADIPAVAEMLGHSNPAVTLSVYTHAVEERKRAVADQSNARFARLTADTVHPILHPN